MSQESVLFDGGDRHTIRAATRGGHVRPSDSTPCPRSNPLAHTDPTPHALQTPPWLYARGAVRPWGEATLHVNTEAVRTGFHIFEGLKAFWQVDGGFGIVNLRDHHARLQRSARIMRMPFAMGFEAYEDACHALLARLARPTATCGCAPRCSWSAATGARTTSPTSSSPPSTTRRARRRRWRPGCPPGAAPTTTRCRPGSRPGPTTWSPASRRSRAATAATAR